MNAASLDKFRAKTNPTGVWQAETAAGTEIDFDFSAQAFCGIKLGDAEALLWKLGPPEDRAQSLNGDFAHYSRGFRVEAENGIIVCFTLCWNPAQHHPFAEFAGVCRHRGQVLPLKAGSAEPEIKQFFGEPYWRDEDEDEVLLFYEFKNVEWQIEISRRAGLTTILVLTPPLMAESRQREAYKVTKAWPPLDAA